MEFLPHHLSIENIPNLLKLSLKFSEEDEKRILDNRTFLDGKLASGATFYGINTGFGSLCNVRVEDDQLSELQENLVCSHACGMGDEIPPEIVKLMLLLKLRNIAQGNSGVHPETAQRLLFLYNNDILPVVYELGSLGASGDLAPLAHLSLPLIGKGQVYYRNVKQNASDVLAELGLTPLKLKAKEGLALLNGTQFMSAFAVWALIHSENLSNWADFLAAYSLEAFDGKKEPFHPAVQSVRPHPGQIATARNILKFLEGSPIQEQEKFQVQDPYSFRCVPQVHGATKDALSHIRNVVEIEINATTDNPLVIESEDRIFSGGNFHGQPLAINLDYHAIAIAELANISERRVYLLVSGQRNLPAFLAKNAGLHSGFMIAQYTAASIVSQNKQYCTPASVDSIVSSNGQEDHVSMGANAATKLYKVVKNVQRVLAIELLTAAQALDFKRPLKSSRIIEQVHEQFRKMISFNDADRILQEDMMLSEHFINKKVSDYLK